MRLYWQSTRDGITHYTSTFGMEESVVISLMEEIGHSSIESITEEAYLAALS